ncbi:hypothetical protein KKF84_04480 [Myxococcota bacterium]|nr:hypothetical protein [Myxococcota bacterium]
MGWLPGYLAYSSSEFHGKQLLILPEVKHVNYLEVKDNTEKNSGSPGSGGVKENNRKLFAIAMSLPSDYD